MEPNTPKILVVDDCQNICKTLKRQLIFNGWEFYSSASGHDGLLTLENEGPFEIVISDYFMPHMNGVKFLKEVNRLWPDTFCLLLTAYPECNDIGQALQQGLRAAVMEKPWKDEVLHQLLRAACETHQTKSQTYDPAVKPSSLGQRVPFTQPKRDNPKQRKNCWEYMLCGREPGGKKVAELGICQATIGLQNDGINGGTASGRACWAIAGTLCSGEVQGSFAKKFPHCLNCPFYQEVHNLKEQSVPSG